MENSTKISMLEPDMENRDPNAINNHSVVTFCEVLGEPDDMHSKEWTWHASNVTFEFAFNCCYKVLAAICGIPLTFLWALQFASVGFCHVWVLTPIVQCCHMNMMLIHRVTAHCTHCLCDPCWESMALVLGHIRYYPEKPES